MNMHYVYEVRCLQNTYLTPKYVSRSRSVVAKFVVCVQNGQAMHYPHIHIAGQKDGPDSNRVKNSAVPKSTQGQLFLGVSVRFRICCSPSFFQATLNQIAHSIGY